LPWLFEKLWLQPLNLRVCQSEKIDLRVPCQRGAVNNARLTASNQSMNPEPKENSRLVRVLQAAKNGAENG